TVDPSPSHSQGTVNGLLRYGSHQRRPGAGRDPLFRKDANGFSVAESSHHVVVKRVIVCIRESPGGWIPACETVSKLAAAARFGAGLRERSLGERAWAISRVPTASRSPCFRKPWTTMWRRTARFGSSTSSLRAWTWPRWGSAGHRPPAKAGRGTTRGHCWRSTSTDT